MTSDADSGHRARDTEVGDSRLASFEEDILRLDVAMDHALGMRIGEGGRHVAADLDRVLEREGALARRAVRRGIPR